MAAIGEDELFSVFEGNNSKNTSKGHITTFSDDEESNSDSCKFEEKNQDSAAQAQEVVRSLTSAKRSPEDEGKTKIKKIKIEEEVMEEIHATEKMPRIQIHTLETVEACMHEVAVPPDTAYVPLQPSTSKPVKEYPFVLDPFQKEAVLCLENNQSVLVSAHTSAGKTVVAEYAIAMSLKEKQRVIYTTPIKALSNQKYREFYEEFSDVGLVTGDVTINPTASCLIMTTEILRSMLYRGSEVMREVAWVIFDEIHYMRDKERGYVWEETIILLPDNVHYVFLSATIPNARQFAEWICHLHHQPCHVVYTDYRPVPLEHYIFPAGGDGIHLVVDSSGNFREDNFDTAMAILANAGDASKGDTKGKRGGFKGETNAYKIVKMIMERNFAPVIVFSFSKKDCEGYALQMAKLDFNSAEEKKLVSEVFSNAMDVLSEEDRKLPQVENVLPLLKRGIGIHHGGLLPILKETIEILFGEGLIKALFATETFAMGLNMPARTVLFTGCRKFDGRDFRWLTSGEYIQMSGRAGRRGKDEKGIVILMVDEKISPAAGKDIVKGQADKLNSAFHLTYNMVLNLLRVEEINPEYMLERSFFQFQNYAAIPGLCEKLRTVREKYDGVDIPREHEVVSYYKIRQQLATLGEEFQSFITSPQYAVPFMNPGRMVHVKSKDQDFGWGVVVNFKKQTPDKKSSSPVESETTYVIDTLLHVSQDSAQLKIPSQLRACPSGEKGEMVVVPVLIDLIVAISAVRLHFPQNLKPLDNRTMVLKSVQEVVRRFPNAVPLLDPVTDMQIKDKNFLEVVRKIKMFEERLEAHGLHKDPDRDRLCDAYKSKVELHNEVKEAKHELKKAKSVLQMDELKCRKRVLRRLGYCTAADVIEVKGRVACELNSADELLLTEMMFNGLFNDLTAGQCVAVMSTFVCDEKSNEAPKLGDELSGPLRGMLDLARRIARVSIEAKLEMNEDWYVDGFKPFMMDVVYAWCNGSTFGDLCAMTDIFEGSIIRCMRRLEELLRQMVQAAKGIGNTELEQKFSEGIKLLKRDIVFAASLYL